MNWYNEIDPYAAQWLRNLIQSQQIPPGTVDERPIQDVRPIDLAPFTQCHFFAGIAGWPLALRLAGFPTDRPVWTGSCPCQPFSAAGKGGGFADERHLWPFWFYLISVCRPGLILGEQVASKSGLAWFDLVQADLEGADYAVGSADLCAAGAGSPHIRQRLWFVADACGERAWRHAGNGASAQAEGDCERIEAWGVARDAFIARGAAGGLEHAAGEQAGLSGRSWESRGAVGELGDPSSSGRPRLGDKPAHAFSRQASPWADCDWLPCTDGKARPVEPGSFPLAHGVLKRASKLRAYGNAIVPQVAAEFIRSTLDIS